MSAARLSPGPLTTQPMTATVMLSKPGARSRHSGARSRRNAWVEAASLWKRSELVRPQPGQLVTIGANARIPIDWRISWATTTSSVRGEPGAGVKETRIVSPMPSSKRQAKAAADATIPFEPIPASVRPRWSA